MLDGLKELSRGTPDLLEGRFVPLQTEGDGVGSGVTVSVGVGVGTGSVGVGDGAGSVAVGEGAGSGEGVVVCVGSGAGGVDVSVGWGAGVSLVVGVGALGFVFAAGATTFAPAPPGVQNVADVVEPETPSAGACARTKTIVGDVSAPLASSVVPAGGGGKEMSETL
jgi:hypothetical protein